MHNSPQPAAVDQILNQWRQKCSPLKIIEPVTSKWRQKCSPLQIIEPFPQFNLSFQKKIPLSQNAQISLKNLHKTAKQWLMK